MDERQMVNMRTFGAAHRGASGVPAPGLSWQRTDGAIPTWELTQDPLLYVEKWGLGSWAAYYGEQRIGEPGTYGTREEAQEAAETRFRREHPVDTRDGFTCGACGGQVTTGDAGLRHLEA